MTDIKIVKSSKGKIQELVEQINHWYEVSKKGKEWHCELFRPEDDMELLLTKENLIIFHTVESMIHVGHLSDIAEEIEVELPKFDSVTSVVKWLNKFNENQLNTYV
jgi:hypothetical protein